MDHKKLEALSDGIERLNSRMDSLGKKDASTDWDNGKSTWTVRWNIGNDDIFDFSGKSQREKSFGKDKSGAYSFARQKAKEKGITLVSVAVKQGDQVAVDYIRS